MSVIDVAALLQEVSPEQPCGDDLEYEAPFQEMERTAEGKPETQFSEAEPPDWRELSKKATEVLTHSRDLRAIIHLANAALHLSDWPTFSDCMTLMEKLLEQRWEHVHPQLDPDDGDSTFRVNVIASLSPSQDSFAAESSFIQHVRNAPLVSSRGIGQFSLRDIEVANGTATASEEGSAPQMSAIMAAFMEVMDSEPDSLQTTAQSLSTATSAVRRVEAILTEQLGVTQAPDLSAVTQELDHAYQFVAEQLASRGLASADQASEASADEANDVESVVAASTQRLSGEISNRDDVIRAIDKICEYYQRDEPSSPVPLLLERAKRLAAKSFLEIIEDMAPDAIAQVHTIRGALPDEAE